MTNALVVEDDPGFRDLLCTSLRGKGLNVIAADCYREGLSKVGTQLFHLFLIDASEETAPPKDHCHLSISDCARRNYPEAVVLCVTGCGSNNPNLDTTSFDDVYVKPYFMQHTDEILRKYGLI